MEKLNGIDALVISQKKEWGEILTGFETKNKYAVLTTSGQQVLAALEDSNVLLRLFLKSMRPFRVDILDVEQTCQLRLRRPFRFYFHQMDVHDAGEQLIGTIKKRFSFVRRIYTVYDDAGNELFELFGPILHPWTFEIRQNGVSMGKITKKWSGLAKEAFTDADNFGIEFPAGCSDQVKAILLGAVFLIDFVHFEQAK